MPERDPKGKQKMQRGAAGGPVRKEQMKAWQNAVEFLCSQDMTAMNPCLEAER
jgi:hypothetical protein